MNSNSIFQEYFTKVDFFDRKIENNEEGIDVIIPIFNTNSLFEKNLINFFKEVPIENLIIGDGGCTDESIHILKKFPRVTIIDQSKYETLGICIAELISKVSTDWFIYLHSDVFLPSGWYDIMRKNQSQYDFFECNRKMTVMIEYFTKDFDKKERVLSGSQMGRKKAFDNIIPKIEDGYLYRNEDIIFSELILQEGYKYGRVFDTYHYHQIMNKRGDLEPNFKEVLIEKESTEQWEIKTIMIQIKGIVKYCVPKFYLIEGLNKNIQTLIFFKTVDIKELQNWIKNTNPVWLKHLKFKKNLKFILKSFYKKIFN